MLEKKRILPFVAFCFCAVVLSDARAAPVVNNCVQALAGCQARTNGGENLCSPFKFKSVKSLQNVKDEDKEAWQ